MGDCRVPDPGIPAAFYDIFISFWKFPLLEKPLLAPSAQLTRRQISKHSSPAAISDEDSMITDHTVSPNEGFYFSLQLDRSGLPDGGNGLAARRSAAKRVIDYAVGSAAVVFFAPLMLGIAIAVKLDSPGPVLFRQPRRGLDNRPFDVFKFRSMHVHFADVAADKQTSRNDPRVTRIGRWLRRLSFDELPQLLNVLRGEMSLVGPRPHAPNTRVNGELLPALSDEYLSRYDVKPGITGWAQVNGARGELVEREDLRKRIAYDLEYIKNWSVGFDLKIMVLTATREIISKHAF
jgi:lipopolysaccharide/colanic/teichoic acid biosynthesis glycosyltransferase